MKRRREKNRVVSTIRVSQATAEAFPTRPNIVDAHVAEVRVAMDRTAAERGRHVSGDPELTWVRETGLGLVELTFLADTEPVDA